MAEQAKAAGKLYLCATPIGNLDDITLRVLNTLKEADLIAAEDTRHSIKLLNHFGIKTPMTSYHEYNKIDKARYLVEQMRQGVNIALVTMQVRRVFLIRERNWWRCAMRQGSRSLRFRVRLRVSRRLRSPGYRRDGLRSRLFCRRIRRRNRRFWRS